MNYVFDVDGTLTPSRGTIDPSFGQWFLNFCQSNPVYLVTGSDYKKTLEQLGEDICNAVRAVYNCSGNAIYVQGQLIYYNDFKISTDLRYFLNTKLLESAYTTRTGQHIEDRIGMCNFSIVGRGANPAQRAQYVEYDHRTSERKILAETINFLFHDVEATIGGETGIDIYQIGRDKSQVAACLSPFVFFGDKTMPGGNDHTISLKAQQSHQVLSWTDTFQLLKDYNAPN